MANGTTRWTRSELLLALHLYERIPFGRQHARNPEVIALAERMGRTPGSVAMKLNNLTSLDPEEKARGVAGLTGASALDRAMWDEFHGNPEVVEEAEEIWVNDVEPIGSSETGYVAAESWSGATEAMASRSVRLAQGYFRRVVLANFDGRCALTGITTPALLTASHIVPWSDNPEQRVNPSNGLCLNRLHDGAFDRGLITFDEQLRLVVGKRLRAELPAEELSAGFLSYEGQPLRPPHRHSIAAQLLALHREMFNAANSR